MNEVNEVGQVLSQNAGKFMDYGLTALGLGLIALAAAVGIGFIGGKALEAIARQPEAKNDIRTLMILSAALIEGVAFFAAVVCLLIVLTK
ncbi:MAG TPA: ATP synthase F0 subunit C [Victivallales bacterium]|nr:ATP synthase F0 subunit C [Victivallales bacterium]HPO89904.1 ATP synthase F0 subunit C [Victivallales bacterium]HRR06224.1 ATP synthase F0 subunit C [Victivallales bacterium]HRR28896.1 ATP synthase F0 subunit C [Victivallales bacterium]HRU01938.1 ATP synthase F0 subunit C [Victivallales bacterium]